MNLTFGEKQISSVEFKRKDKIVMLPVSDIAPNPLQPRKNFNEDEITFLAESIKQFGIIQPIAVKLRENAPCLKLNNEKIYTASYEIIAGERRWKRTSPDLPCLRSSKTSSVRNLKFLRKLSRCRTYCL